MGEAAVRKAIILIVLLVMAVVPVLAGCSDNAPGPGTTDNSAAGPGPTEPGPTEPEPTEPAEPAGPEFPQGLFGAVFADANANGTRDAGESGVKGVLISNAIACRPTDADGVYNLPSDNSLVFMTVPGDSAATGPWYSKPASGNIDFGLKPDPSKGSGAFTFVQMSDLHAGQEQAAALADLAARVNSLSPAFVVATGDLVVDGNDATIATARGWFDVYENFTSGLGMPVYQAMGNHDVVGIHRSDAAASGSTTDPAYGEGLFVSRFGPTYYSFDWGRYHCIILDPNDMEGGKEVYRISDAQVQWLKDDLSCRKDAPLLVFYHEPTVSWTNRSAVLSLLQGHSATLFCGHLHQGVTLSSAGIPEQVTAAVSGEWWHGPNPDGRPAGFRLVSAGADGVGSLYMGTDDMRTVDFGLSPLVNGRVDLAIKAFSRYGPGGSGSAGITAATCTVDDNQTVPVTLRQDGPWSVVAGSWDTASLGEGYHHLTLTLTDAAGTFQKRFDFKQSQSGTASLSDLTDHRDVFWGQYVPVEATVGLMLAGPASFGSVSVPPGVGFIFLTDGSDVLVVVAGEVFSPSLLTALARPGTAVIVKVVPLRLTMTQVINSAEWNAYYPLITSYLNYIPASAREPVDAASITDLVAVWGARWLSADDLTVKPA